MSGRPTLLLSLALVVTAVGCGSTPRSPDTPDGEDVAQPFQPEVAPLTSASGAPDELAAREHLATGRYDEALEAFTELAKFEADPARRAEFLFFAAEAALGAGDHEEAYDGYRKLLRRFPSTPRYPLVVDRIFLIGRLYALGRAETSTWFFGMDMTDRGLGIEILEEFQKARERHPLADDALHAIAEARVAEEEHGLAIDAWQKLMTEYPRSEWAETAEFRIAMTFGAMSDGTDYDKRPLLTSLQRLRSYVLRHKTGNHVTEANAEITRLEEDLAEQQIDVARFYLRGGRRYSAIVCLDEVLREYPRTEAAREATRLKLSLPQVEPPPPKQLSDDDEVETPEEDVEAPPPPLPQDMPGAYQAPTD